jgi:hypothetical protein
MVDHAFFSVRTIDQPIAGQGILPVSGMSALAGKITDKDIDRFVADPYQDGEADRELYREC